jgi:hypothetical protein
MCTHILALREIDTMPLVHYASSKQKKKEEREERKRKKVRVFSNFVHNV